MGQCTVTVYSQTAYAPVGGAGDQGFAVFCQITMSSSYAAGGDTITPAMFGLGTLTKLMFSGNSIGGGTTSYDPAAVYSGTTGEYQPIKVQAFLAQNEASGNLSAVTFDAIVYGY